VKPTQLFLLVDPDFDAQPVVFAADDGDFIALLQYGKDIIAQFDRRLVRDDPHFLCPQARPAEQSRQNGRNELQKCPVWRKMRHG
jgi:hypothetical protein